MIIGAGPAGLTAAHALVQRDAPVVVFEQADTVGGLARTVEYKGFRFDIGGHRFFTKIAEIQSLWRSMLGPDFLARPRLSRIDYRGRFLNYALQALNVLRSLGLLSSVAVLLSYVRSALFPIRPEVTFEDWVTNASGAGCTRCSSRPTRRRCGASRANASAPNGRRSASAVCRSEPRSPACSCRPAAGRR